MKFNIQRFFNLIKRDFITYKKPIGYGLVGILGLILFIWVIINRTSHEDFIDVEFWITWWAIFLFIGGLLLTSAVFWEFKTPAGRVQYLSLPASHVEKWASRWLYSLILYPVFISAVFYFIGKVSASNIGYEGNDTREVIGILINVFVIVHSIMFVFAIAFNRFVAGKAMLTTILLLMIFTIIMALIFWLLFYSYFEGPWRDGPTIQTKPNDGMEDFVTQTLAPVLEFSWWYLVAPYFWVVSYFKMKEKEA